MCLCISFGSNLNYWCIGFAIVYFTFGLSCCFFSFDLCFDVLCFHYFAWCNEQIEFSLQLIDVSVFSICNQFLKTNLVDFRFCRWITILVDVCNEDERYSHKLSCINNIYMTCVAVLSKSRYVVATVPQHSEAAVVHSIHN